MNKDSSGYPGNLFVIAAPSGAGKTSLVSALIKKERKMVHSISYTTRPMRPKEQQGINYNFISVDEFTQMIADNLFLEWAQVFQHYYGTSSQSIEKQLQESLDIILEIDWQGAAQIKKLFPESISIFILPPSREVLRNRLNARKQDEQAVIDHRMSKASSEIKHYQDFDYLIINDDFNEALHHLSLIVQASHLRQAEQAAQYKQLLAELLKK